MMIRFAASRTEQHSSRHWKETPKIAQTEAEQDDQEFEEFMQYLREMSLKEDTFTRRKEAPTPPPNPVKPVQHPYDRILEKKANQKPSPLKNSFTAEDLRREQAEQALREKSAKA